MEGALEGYGYGTHAGLLGLEGVSSVWEIEAFEQGFVYGYGENVCVTKSQ